MKCFCAIDQATLPNLTNSYPLIHTLGWKESFSELVPKPQHLDTTKLQGQLRIITKQILSLFSSGWVQNRGRLEQRDAESLSVFLKVGPNDALLP
jgi:hypothetical protein